MRSGNAKPERCAAAWRVPTDWVRRLRGQCAAPRTPQSGRSGVNRSVARRTALLRGRYRLRRRAGQIGRDGTGAKRQGLSRYDNQAARAETYGKFSGPTTGSARTWSSRCRKPGQISPLSASQDYGARLPADSERLEGAPRPSGTLDMRGRFVPTRCASGPRNKAGIVHRRLTAVTGRSWSTGMSKGSCRLPMRVCCRTNCR